MINLEAQRKKLELSRVRVAREDMELKIAERMEEISRIQDHIKIQIEKEEELSSIIKDLERK